MIIIIVIIPPAQTHSKSRPLKRSCGACCVVACTIQHRIDSACSSTDCCSRNQYYCSKLARPDYINRHNSLHTWVLCQSRSRSNKTPQPTCTQRPCFYSIQKDMFCIPCRAQQGMVVACRQTDLLACTVTRLYKSMSSTGECTSLNHQVTKACTESLVDTSSMAYILPPMKSKRTPAASTIITTTLVSVISRMTWIQHRCITTSTTTI